MGLGLIDVGHWNFVSLFNCRSFCIILKKKNMNLILIMS